MNKVLLSHPTGNANVRAALDGLHSANMLHSFHTSVATYPNNIFGLLSKLPGGKEFLKRSYPVYNQQFTKQYPYKELGRMLCSKLKLRSPIIHEKGIFSVDEIYQSIDREVANYIDRQNDMAGIYAYEDGALASFQAAGKMGKICLYDLPIGYWRSMRRFLEKEKEEKPEWAMTLGGFKDSEAKLQRKDQELALASRIYVASSFTKKTLTEYPGLLAPVEVIPYGFPMANTGREYISPSDRKLRLLYVGGLSQRKGIAYLFDAIKGLEAYVELTVVGRGDIEKCPALQKALLQHRYISALPHQRILELMASHDVLVFPSLFEGFGLVITEAMSQGTPVITTDRTCGPDIIQHGENGWLIDAGTANAIREQIMYILESPQEIKRVGENALHTATLRSWLQYGIELISSIQRNM
ncbi:glycosyl transferase family 1 [Sphingobacterium allocomposti]|uniref:Glycosyl transferase family 1 n=1 Tax=Sphingobacterium allocomposti TaxID=415956 RepID=A0A5S5D531_9SPHI|nr:glycosyltransferase family 4 protein [Sphingobacterium composti Yoo et al. 2007 non Ten et al. 2007]TYP91080.1 glycosyl transferase family 1 [Sphingobacterium composti Yoo et al. 2007 non Ten et al. 2007]